MDFTHYALKGIGNTAQVDVLYTDFTKAFDRVNHQILLNKLEEFEIPINLLKGLGSYLTGRTMFVEYGKSVSGEFKSNSGLPQGCHLGPTLFVLFINDIIQAIGDKVFVSLFADDVKIAKIINIDLDIVTLQEAINQLKNWCETNRLSLNLYKCPVLSITRRNVTQTVQHRYQFGDYNFTNVTEQKDLGILIDSKMNFAQHIITICSKAQSALGFLKRFCYDIYDVQTLKIVYYTLVRSHLEYGNIIWLPYHEVHKQKIEPIQRKFTGISETRKQLPCDAIQSKNGKAANDVS